MESMPCANGFLARHESRDAFKAMVISESKIQKLKRSHGKEGYRYGPINSGSWRFSVNL